MAYHTLSAPLSGLLETATRKRLIHVNRSARRANVLDVVGERSVNVFDLLRTNDKSMRFQPAEEDETPPGADKLALVIETARTLRSGQELARRPWERARPTIPARSRERPNPDLHPILMMLHSGSSKLPFSARAKSSIEQKSGLRDKPAACKLGSQSKIG